MDKFFALLGKILVFVGVAGILVGGGYYLGTKLNKPVQNTQPSAISSAPTNIVPTSSQIISPTSSAIQKNTTGRVAVNAGGIKPFSAYLLSGVAGWIPAKIVDANTNKLVLTKANYSVTILQGAFGGAGCTFPGDKPAEMSIQLTSSMMIELSSGNPLRRGQAQSTNANETDFTVCQKLSDGSYGTITDFGAINYVTPLNPDAATLAEMDAMVGSLQKQ